MFKKSYRAIDNMLDFSLLKAERERISKIMETTYKSEIGELVIPPEDVVEHQVHIFKDRDGILHRAMLIKKNLIKSTFKLLDVDTTQTFITLKLEAFKMVPEVSNFWFQVNICNHCGFCFIEPSFYTLRIENIFLTMSCLRIIYFVNALGGAK